MEVNHKNGNRADARAANLEWVTPSENQRHSVATGLRVEPRGTDRGQAKLNDDAIRQIRRLAPLRSQRDLAREFGVSRALIRHVIERRLWRHI
jgi:hypothetical protein